MFVCVYFLSCKTIINYLGDKQMESTYSKSHVFGERKVEYLLILDFDK